MTAHCSNRTRPFRRTLLAACCSAALSPVFAQSAAAPAGAASDVQRVEVTGSRIKQIDAETASPVQVIRKEDIAHTGATTVREMLASLSATTTLSGVSPPSIQRSARGMTPPTLPASSRGSAATSGATT